ncbi:MAG: 4'-phosphopantetheinyl transferase superfamily protein, partial [Agathobaculum butyriciproducens]
MTHLFALSAAAADIMNISLRSRLSAARLTYIDSLHGTSRQQSFSASLLLDEAIRLCCPSVPRPLDIAANENGKPYLTAAPDVHFSLSHSAAWAVCAVSDHPVGVDIQQRRSFKPNIADRFFHPDEVQYLSSLSPAERENAFYTLWALKESYVKADGRGLRLLRQFCVD